MVLKEIKGLKAIQEEKGQQVRKPAQNESLCSKQLFVEVAVWFLHTLRNYAQMALFFSVIRC